jgi:hypothetical protein
VSVNGYWLVNVTKGPHAGHSAVIWTGAASPSSQLNLSPAVLKALGASSSSQVASYYMGGDPKNISDELFKAIGKLNVSLDQVPILPSSGTPQQILGSDLIKPLNFDYLAPVGETSSQAYQATKPAADTFQNIINGLSDWQQLVVRALEALVGVALIFLGLQALTGTGSQGNPVQAVRSAAGAAKYIR